MSTYAINKSMIKSVTELLGNYDAKLLEDTKKWALERIEEISAFRMSDECKAMSSSDRYGRLFYIAGGKTWYELFYGRNWDMIEELITKNHIAKTEKRNYKIAKKLVDSGVTDVDSIEVSYSEHGFNGVYKINSDDGVRYVRIDTIYAGGYNVQCAHLRVLVKVSKK